MYEEMDVQPSGSNDVLSTAQSLVDYCNCGRQREQRVAANRLHDLLSSTVDMSPVVKYFGGFSRRRTKSKMEEALDNTKTLFKAIEMAEDDLAIIVLCRLAEALISDSSSNKSASKRHRRLVKADACSSIIRALRSRFRASVNVSPLASTATDSIAALLLSIGSKDPRITLKIRVGALIQPLCAMVADWDSPLGDTPILLRLLCRAVRSPRNGQLAGRQKDFPSVLETKMGSLSAAGNRGQLELIRLARYVEILYFICKNKKTRVHLIQDGLVGRTLIVLQQQLEHRNSLRNTQGNEASESIATEICLVVVALLRLLSNNKKAKEELVSLGAIGMSEKALSALTAENSSSQNARQLQDSLCALCLRCLPLVPFPVADHLFPFRCPIPRSQSPSKRRSSSKSSSMKSGTSTSIATPSPMKKISEEAVSSDDDGMDEEDEVFFTLDDTRVMKSEGEDEREDDDRGRKLTHTKLKANELANYDPFFIEWHQSATTSSPIPWNGYESSLLSNVKSTSSVVPFVKIAFPEMNNPDVDLPKQPLCSSSHSMTQAVVQQLSRTRSRVIFNERVVFNLDELYSGCGLKKSKPPAEKLICEDVQRVGKIDESKDHLMFESRFESGNLRRATQVSPTHYELVLSPDINQISHHYQWFYFEVSNIRPNIEYTFEIVNCLKSTSMFSHGMQPVMYSVKEAMNGRGGWTRIGDGVCYYRNLYTADGDQEDSEKAKKKNFFSIRFNVKFRHAGDICYFAYHFPYTHSYMKTTIDRCLSRLRPSVFCRTDAITTSVGGNPVQMITVTGPGTSADLVARDTVVISARVHPGESNASWMMHGIIEQLLCNASLENSDLLSKFIFKLIPMLNPDGVINGSHRCSLAGIDLNRVWDKPNSILHPEIYHSKGIIQYMVDILGRTPFIYVDLHGHSRRSNVFVYGNNPEESYRALDKLMVHNNEYISLQEQLEEISPSFSSPNCQYNITRGKESSARVATWRQFGISRAYTMESTYCGFERGPYKGFQIGTRELKEMGADLLRGILAVKADVTVKEQTGSTPKKKDTSSPPHRHSRGFGE